MAGDEMGGERLVVGGVKITVTRKIFFFGARQTIGAVILIFKILTVPA